MMYAFRQQCLACLSLLILLICVVHTFRINDLENGLNENHLGNDNNAHAAAAARLHALNQMWARRSLYDPAFGDSWSNYLEKKRSLFDPAYSDWANSFKRSNE